MNLQVQLDEKAQKNPIRAPKDGASFRWEAGVLAYRLLGAPKRKHPHAEGLGYTCVGGHVHVPVRVPVRVRVRVCLRVRVRERVCACARACVSACVGVCARAGACARVRARACACVRAWDRGAHWRPSKATGEGARGELSG